MPPSGSGETQQAVFSMTGSTRKVGLAFNATAGLCSWGIHRWGWGQGAFPDKQKEPWKAVCSVITQALCYFLESPPVICLPVLNFSGPGAFILGALSFNLGGWGTSSLTL